MHARQQIAEAVKGLLGTGRASAWRSVFVSAIVPGAASMPCVLVRAAEESVGPVPDSGTLDAEWQWRTLVVSLLWVARPLANPEDTASASSRAAAEIETIVTLDALQSALPGIKFAALQDTQINEAPDVDTGFVNQELVWNIVYMTREGAPETLLD